VSCLIPVSIFQGYSFAYFWVLDSILHIFRYSFFCSLHFRLARHDATRSYTSPQVDFASLLRWGSCRDRHETAFCTLRISRARWNCDARAWALHLVLFRIVKENITFSEFASVKRKQDVKVTRVQRSFCVRTIYLEDRSLYPSGQKPLS